MNQQTTLDEKLVGAVLFPFSSHLMNRRDISSNYRDLIKSQWFPEDQLHEIQSRRLRETIAYANEYVPFYQKRFRDAGLEPGDIRDKSDLSGIPPLARQDLIDNRHDLIDRRLRDAAIAADQSGRGPGLPGLLARFQGNKLVRNSSSGSTGAPTIFYEDGSMTALNWAFEQRFKNWFGLEPGTREARMYRFPLNFTKVPLSFRVRRWFWNQLVLPGSNLTEQDYAFCLARIKAFNPRVIWGFTTALTGLAEYIRDTGENIDACRPTLLIGWAAPIYDHEERILRDVFDCHVTNIYGAREVGHIAAKCPAGNFHVNDEFIVLEEETGTGDEQHELLTTTLNKTPMPFIRYRMGDIGRVTHERCECGRTLSVLTDFVGRTGEQFVTKDGHMISPNFWCRTFMAYEMSEAVRRFQIVYKRDDLIHVKIQKNKNFTEKNEQYLRGFLDSHFGKNITTVFEYVDDIPPEISGKYKMVVNETNTSDGVPHAH